MSNRQAYPNQLVSFTVQAFVSGQPVSVTLTAGTLTIAGGSPLTCTISGPEIFVTVPNDQALGPAQTFLWQWTQVIESVTSNQSASYPVDIVAQPSSSTVPQVPSNVSRQCVRLAEPADNTVEQYNSQQSTLAIYCQVPFDLIQANAANFPTSGPDLMTISYVDNRGQLLTFAFNCTLWCSDNGYIFVSADNGSQYLVASINAEIWNSAATDINDRNVTNGANALKPCSNPARYDYPALLPNQAIPQTFYYDGVLLVNGNA